MEFKYEQQGTIWKPVHHGYRHSIIEDEQEHVSEDGTLEGLIKKHNGDARQLPKIIDFGKAVRSNSDVYFTEIKHRIDLTKSEAETFPFKHNAIGFVKDFVKEYYKEKTLKSNDEILVISTQKPLNYAMTAGQLLKKYIKKSVYGYNIEVQKFKAKDKLPSHFQLSCRDVYKDDSAKKPILVSGIPYENVMKGVLESAKKTRVLYSIHSFTYKNEGKIFRFFYSSEIDAIDELIPGGLKHCPVEVKAYHPSENTNRNIFYRFKLKNAYVKTKLSNIPRLYIGIKNTTEFVYETTQLYKEDQLDKIPHLKQLRSNDDHRWTIQTLESNFKLFTRQLVNNNSRGAVKFYCTGRLNEFGMVKIDDRLNLKASN